MCGIVGYIGGRDAVPILLDGLQRLEYRGYDSAGLAVLNGHGLDLVKTAGKLTVLGDRIRQAPPEGRMGIAHTRWATHGEPTDSNAHPHSDCSGKFAVVHNGIIENYRELRQWLLSKGHRLLSETDTEVLPHLIEHYYRGDLLTAVRSAIKDLDGSYAIAAICEGEPGRIIAARKDSPLVIGLGDGENYLASDIPAILPHTRRSYILSDGEVVDLRRDRVTITDQTSRPVDKEVFQVTWDASAAEKGGYSHFMLKEIHEQPRAVRDTLRGRLDEMQNQVVLPELEPVREQLAQAQNMVFVACGTAYHAGLVGRTIMEKLAGIRTEADLASEFRYRDPLITANTVVVVISQSGETADSLAALREAKRRGALILAVVNVVGSSIAREADAVLYTWAGPEIAVASTKAYVTQLITLKLLAIYLRQLRSGCDQLTAGMVKDLAQVPELLEKVLALEPRIVAEVQSAAKGPCCFFIGRGLDYPVAMEGALKLKEISYIHAEAYAAGELKHGTLALIEPGVPTVALATQSTLLEKLISNIKEIKARGGYILGITGPEGEKSMAEVADAMIILPRMPAWMAPPLAVVPLQLLAYHAAVHRGCDVDQPRNLAKSVTVE